jgi:copper chaperone CopZ
VAGLTCATCVQAVERALRAVPGVTGATVNLTGGRAFVGYDPGKASVPALVDAVKAAGYRGKPVRLNFVRQESASCSEMVLLPAFHKNAQLPEGQTVPVEFLPKERGEHEFACQMGMIRGKVLVE